MTNTDAFHTVDPKFPQAIDLKRTSRTSASALTPTSASHASTRRYVPVCGASARRSARMTSSGSSAVTRRAAKYAAKSAAPIPMAAMATWRDASIERPSTGKRS